MMQPTPGAPTFCTTAPLSHATVDTSFTMDAVDLDTPMSTLRNIASLSKDTIQESYTMTYDPIFPIITREERQAFEQDPVAQGLLTMEEAQEAFDMSVDSGFASDLLSIHTDQLSDSSQIVIPWHHFCVFRPSARQLTCARVAQRFSCLCVRLELDFGTLPASMLDTISR
jgi:hypothetical protein